MMRLTRLEKKFSRILPCSINFCNIEPSTAQDYANITEAG